jgi:hypothetical protein
VRPETRQPQVFLGEYLDFADDGGWPASCVSRLQPVSALLKR